MKFAPSRLMNDNKSETGQVSQICPVTRLRRPTDPATPSVVAGIQLVHHASMLTGINARGARAVCRTEHDHCPMASPESRHTVVRPHSSPREVKTTGDVATSPRSLPSGCDSSVSRPVRIRRPPRTTPLRWSTGRRSMHDPEAGASQSPREHSRSATRCRPAPPLSSQGPSPRAG